MNDIFMEDGEGVLIRTPNAIIMISNFGGTQVAVYEKDESPVATLHIKKAR